MVSVLDLINSNLVVANSNFGAYIPAIYDYLFALGGKIDSVVAAVNGIEIPDGGGSGGEIVFPDIPDYSGQLSSIETLLTLLLAQATISDVADAVIGDLDMPALGDSISELAGLMRNKLPFCVLFDLVSIFTLFDMPSEAPQFDFEVPNGFNGDTEKYHIDLSPFNDLAVASRGLMLILFIVGLIWATKNFMFGGKE